MVQVTEYYILFKDNTTNEIFIEFYPTKDKMFTEASRFYAFSDCDDTYSIVEIICENKKCYYFGWRPDMEFVFVDQYDTQIWSNYFSGWEH